MMKAKYLITLICTALTLLCSCSREDDINEIFIGKTWYMNAATVNGMKWNSEIKTFYEEGNDAYKISFSSNTFQATLSKGQTFYGTWEADGKSQTLSLKISSPQSSLNNNDRMLYNILKNTKNYKSGADFMHIIQDGNNKILFGDARDKVYN